MNWSRAAGTTHFLLRAVAGLLFLQSGGLKLLGWFGGMPPGVTLTPLITAAAVIELMAGLLILVGLFTRAAAFLASGEMAVAYFKGHFHLPGGFWPIQNHGEPAVLFCFLFLFLWANGPGPWSLDGRILRRRDKNRT
jgi:putative oxidoreductase